MALFKKERVFSRPFGGEEFAAIVYVVATRKECDTEAVRSPDPNRDKPRTDQSRWLSGATGFTERSDSSCHRSTPVLVF